MRGGGEGIHSTCTTRERESREGDYDMKQEKRSLVHVTDVHAFVIACLHTYWFVGLYWVWVSSFFTTISYVVCYAHVFSCTCIHHHTSPNFPILTHYTYPYLHRDQSTPHLQNYCHEESLCPLLDRRFRYWSSHLKVGHPI